MLRRRDIDHNTPPSRSPTTAADLEDSMMPLTPPGDARNVSDDRGPPEEKVEHRFETTADGDVRTIVVEPSFNTDSLHKQGNHPVSESSKEQDAASATMSPDRRDGAPDVQSPGSAGMPPGRGHARNLSAQFYEGLHVSEQQGVYPVQQSSRMDDDPSELSPHVKTDVAKPEVPSPGQDPGVVPAAADPAADSLAGQKHHRGFSSDLSNPPPHAHRRMNSLGNSLQVDGSGAPYPKDQPGDNAMPPHQAHHRKTSSGLDMLSAAAGFSKEDLAIAAGAREPPEEPTSSPWEETPSGESQPPQRSPVEGIPRMSPTAVSAAGSYDYARQGPVPPPPYGGPPPHGPPAGYPQYHGHGPPPPPYHHHPAPYYHGGPPPPSYHHHSSYPVQYAPPRGSSGGGPPPYHQHKGSRPASAPLPQQPVLHSPPHPEQPQPTTSTGRIDMFPWRNQPQPEQQGVTTGAQTMVTAIDVGEGNKVVHTTPITRTASTNTESGPNPAPIPSTVAHHRRMSSFGSLSTMLGSAAFPEQQQQQQASAAAANGQGGGQSHQEGHHRSNSSTFSFLLEDGNKRPHHRSTSSTASFLNYLEDQPLTNEAFMQAVAAPVGPAGGYPVPGAPPPAGYGPLPPASYGGYAPVPPPQHGYGRGPPLQVAGGPAKNAPAASKLATGGTSKRARRKCTVEGCTNRVVQGGLCISHGAKRKQCKHPGCTKNVKKAGLCSAHGPARKRCEHEGCNKVAVQGGRCIKHGAKKKHCSVEGCEKQAILGGMCKKHHDASLPPSPPMQQYSAPPPPPPPMPSHPARPQSHPTKPTHTRGLSIFQEITPDAVQDLLNPSPPASGSY